MDALPLQEFMLLPIGATNFAEAMRMASETYHYLKDIIKAKYGLDACNVGDEGGFAPNIQTSEEGLELLKAAIDKAGYTGKLFIGMDAAASEFFKQACSVFRRHMFRIRLSLAEYSTPISSKYISYMPNLT
jgi:enolase